PSVTLTALARTFTPRSMRWRASSENRTSFGVAMTLVLLEKGNGNRGVFRLRDGGLLLDDRHHVVFTHDEQLFAVDLDLGAGVLAEQHLVALLEVERANLAVLEKLALADGHDLAA